MKCVTNKHLIIIHDFIVCIFAWQLSWWLRFNLDFPFFNWQLSIYTLPIVIVVQALVFHRFKLHRGLWRFASLPDLWNIFRASIFGAVSITLIFFVWFRLEGIPRSILILYPVLLIFFLGGPRLTYRMWKENSFNFKPIKGISSVLIVGAGKAAEMLVRDIMHEGQYYVVGFVDDDKHLIDSEIHGVRVIGNIDDIPNVCKSLSVKIIMIAIPSATSEQMQKIISCSEKTGLPMRTLPSMKDMVSGKVTLNQLRDVSIEDLLGRERVELDNGIIEKGIRNKRILISGGGGSIGSELCKLIAQYLPRSIIILERSEYNLYRVQNEFKSLDVHVEAILGDICDLEKIEYVFDVHEPDVVFHAAAYKHVPILEQHIREAIKNNVIGTKNIADAANKYNCQKFIFISTDKAVNPANVLGASKRISEMYCEELNKKSNTSYMTVRFGNVLNSEGSVIPLFHKQIQSGGPVTVTHEDITRFFMTIREACQLILQSAGMGNGGEIFVLDMGEPIKIKYLAEQMIQLSGLVPGEDIEIKYTGLRPGEKMYEELFYESEVRAHTSHKKIKLAKHDSTKYIDIDQKISNFIKFCLIMDDDSIKLLIDELIPSIKDMESSNIISLQACNNQSN